MANDAENIIDLYDRNAEAWDRERPRKLLERAWLERFLSLVALGGRVLDIGCGTAEPIARFFIDGGICADGHRCLAGDDPDLQAAICELQLACGRYANACSRQAI